MSVTIFGQGDAGIEIEGDIREEFYVPNASSGEPYYIALSNGMVVRLGLTEYGKWVVGAVVYTDEHEFHTTLSDTDHLTIREDITWAVCGKALARSKEDEDQ